MISIFFREREKQDVVEFNIAQYMMQHGMSMMSSEDALKKEQEEYIDAKNKQDVAEKQVRTNCSRDTFRFLNFLLKQEPS